MVGSKPVSVSSRVIQSTCCVKSVGTYRSYCLSKGKDKEFQYIG